MKIRFCSHWAQCSNPLATSGIFLLLFVCSVLLTSCLSDPNKNIEGVHPLMGNGYGIVSSTLVVEDLQSTRDYFSEVLGFGKPKPDESNQGIFEGTTKASIKFADNSGLDLVSLDDSLQLGRRDSFLAHFLQQQEGVRMYTLSSSFVEGTHEWLSSKGFEVDSVRDIRMTPDTLTGWDADAGGPQLQMLGVGGNNPVAKLPHFAQRANLPYDKVETDWITYYNYQRSFIKHPNGVVGTAAIQIAVEDFNASRKALRKMGLVELEVNKEEQFARYQIKRNQELQLRAPQSQEDEVGRFLAERGEGVFGIILEVDDLQATHDTLSARLPENALRMDTLTDRITVLREHAFGVQLAFQEEPAEQGLQAEKLNINFAGKLDSTAIAHAEDLYIKYCALCHGENREGYAADFAPSLRSHSLLSTSMTSNFMRYTVQFGREGTAMAGYLKDQGGPLDYIEIELLLKWLNETAGVEKPTKLSRDPIAGDVELGATLYAKYCTACHGVDGEGITAPALGNPMLLATATDDFLRYAIAEGRDSTPMVAFKDSLSTVEIEALTAFLRSRASGWNVPENDTIRLPIPEEYVLNPNSQGPNFDLRDGRFVSAAQVKQALDDSLRFVLLDARSKVAWRQTHIPGAVPVPYYEEPKDFIQHIPNDSTFVVAYCACPHAASGRVINTLQRFGYKHTAILDEGILVWAQMGYPVRHGQ
ncbi:MAG: c-type cytochrome [Saprospiraceae bacterium]|nr:c-type cytochrome [Saprospiraceae bacterium]